MNHLIRSLGLGLLLSVGMSTQAQQPYTVTINGQVSGCTGNSVVSIVTLPGTDPALDIHVPVLPPDCGFSTTLDLANPTGGFIISVPCLGIMQRDTVFYQAEPVSDSIMVSVVFNCGTSNPDCLGIPGGSAQPGTACTTFLGTPGTWSPNCECIGNTASCAACFNMAQTAPNTATFTSCSTGGVGPYTYLWDFSGPGGGGVQGDGVEHVFPGIGQYTVCLNITDAEGCMDVLCQVVYVDEEGNVSYDVPNDCQACVAISQTQGAGGPTPWSVDLTSCSSGTAPMLVEWSLPDGTWTNGTSTTYTTNTSGRLYFCATITAANGCTNTACDSAWFDDNGWIVTNPIYFDCLQIPNGPNVQGTPCTDPATGITGTWSASCECITEPIDCQAGFWVIQAYEGDSLNGSVTPIPYELWVWNLSTGTSPFQFLWSFGDGTTSTDPFPTHVYAESGPYLLCLTMTDAMGCTSTSCDTVSIDGNGLSGGMAPVGGGARAGFTIRVMNQLPTGMEPRPAFTDIRQWPNPVSGTLNLRFDTEQRGHLPMHVIDMNGRVVLSANTTITVGTNQVEVATSTLPAGMYTLRLGEGTKSMSFRFVKH